MIVWPGLRRSVSAIQRLFNGASFSAPLTHSAIPTRAASGTTATFTRATTATVRDNEGVLRTAIAGEARFEGARRVRNRLTFTEDVTNPAWSLGGLTAPSASSIKETAVSIAHSLYRTDVTGTATWQLQAEVKPDGRDWVAVWFFAAGTVKGILANVATGAFVSNLDGANLVSSYDITATDNGYYRVSIVGTLALVQCGFSASDSATPTLTATKLPTYLGDITKGLFVRKFQLEDITGRADQTTPSEYVSVGVTSAPYYHGSAADGVRAYPYDLSGNPIPSTTLLGYQAEGARTNLCLQSNDPSNASWTKSAFITTTQNAVSPVGATNAWTITATAGATFAVFLQNITVAADTNSYTASCFVKKTTGTPATYPMFELQHSSATKTAGVVINTTSGTLTNRSVGGAIVAPDAKTITSWNDDYWRVTVTLANNSGTTSTIAFYPSINSDGTGVIVSGTLGSAVFYGAQVELGSFATSYIPTTTVAVTRNADVLTYSGAGNIDGTKGWCYAEVTYPNGAGLQKGVINTSNGAPLYISSTNKVSLYDGTSERFGTSFSVSANTQKIASTWGGAASSTANAGVVTATSGFDGDLSLFGSLEIGSNTGGLNSAFGIIRGIRIGQRLLSTSEEGAITA